MDLFKKGFWILFPVVLTVLLTYFLSRKNPDIRYTLSEEIPVTFVPSADSGGEIVQQMEVKNVGNASSNKIVVKIGKKVTDYILEKYAQSDNVDIFDNKSSFEFIYSELPPDGGFRLVFTTIGNGVKFQDVTVSDSTGIAKEALATNQNWFIRNLNYFISIFYLGLVLYSGRKIFVDLDRKILSNDPVNKVMEKRKPWYTFSDEWNTLKLNAARETIKYESDFLIGSDDLLKTNAYKILESDKYEWLSQPDWDDLIKIGIGKLKTLYRRGVAETSSRNQLLRYLEIKKPARFPEKDWMDLLKFANNQYVTLEISHTDWAVLSFSKNRKGMSKPGPLSLEAWGKIMDYHRKYYSYELIKDLLWQTDLNDFLQGLDWEILGDENRQIASYLKDRLDEIQEEELKYKTTRDILEKSLRGEALPDERIEIVDSWIWSKVQEVSQLYEQSKQVEELEMKLQRDQLEITQLKEKVSLQVDVIHQVLNDPTFISRVEEYDDTFAPGNWQNLKIIAQTLAEKKGFKNQSNL